MASSTLISPRPPYLLGRYKRLTLDLIISIITIIIIVIIYFLIIIVVQFYGKVESIGVIRWFVLNQVKEAWIIINSPNRILGKKNESGTGENWRKRIRQKQIK